MHMCVIIVNGYPTYSSLSLNKYVNIQQISGLDVNYHKIIILAASINLGYARASHPLVSTALSCTAVHVGMHTNTL